VIHKSDLLPSVMVLSVGLLVGARQTQSMHAVAAAWKGQLTIQVQGPHLAVEITDPLGRKWWSDSLTQRNEIPDLGSGSFTTSPLNFRSRLRPWVPELELLKPVAGKYVVRAEALEDSSWANLILWPEPHGMWPCTSISGDSVITLRKGESYTWVAAAGPRNSADTCLAHIERPEGTNVRK
jgi:hypothetical protein